HLDLRQESAVLVNHHYKVQDTYTGTTTEEGTLNQRFTSYKDGVLNFNATGIYVRAVYQATLVTEHDGKTYAYADSNYRDYTITIEPVQMSQLEGEDPVQTNNIINIYYLRTISSDPGTPPPTPGTTYYGITVKYVDEAGKELSAAHTERHYAGYSYDVTDKTTLEIADYTIKSVTGDTLAGRLNGDKVITVVYAPVVVIPDEPVPEGGKPGEVILPDTEPPKNELPEELEDGEVPLDAAPKTGDTATLWTTLMAVSGFGLAALAIFKGKKKEEDSAE
ncbi:MAG: MucBP domain-containing protein, partial [Oscillospiraceae bacterium]